MKELMKIRLPSGPQPASASPGRLWLWTSAMGAILMTTPPTARTAQDTRQTERDRMVREQIAERGITNQAVLRALRAVPRHAFVPLSQQWLAYADRPLPIGHGQTISQPYIVALMTELLDVKPGQKILEIGTGSGYQAAVLRELTTNVYTIEIVKELVDQARPKLLARGFAPDQVRLGDGYQGLAEAAPFDGIMVTAAPEDIPPPLLKQLRPGGRLVIPLGPVYATQRLVLVRKDAEGKLHKENILPVMFVPLTGGKPK